MQLAASDPTLSAVPGRTTLRKLLAAVALLVLVAVPVALMQHYVSAGAAVALLIGILMFGPIRIQRGPGLALLLGGVTAPLVVVAGVVGEHPGALAIAVGVAALGAGISTRWSLYAAAVFIPITVVVMAEPVPLPTAFGHGVGLLAGVGYGVVLFGSGSLRFAMPPIEPPLTATAALWFGAALAVITAAATWLVLASNMAHGYWVPLTILAVAQPAVSGSRVRALRRVSGILLGALLAVVITLLVGNQTALFGIGLLFAVAAVSLVQSVTLRTALTTVTVIVLSGSHAGLEGVPTVKFGLTLAAGFAILAVYLIIPMIVRRVRSPRVQTGTAVALSDLDPRTRRDLIAGSILRVLRTSIALFVLYYLLPLTGLDGDAAAFYIIIGGLVFIGTLAWQLRGVLVARYPQLQAIEAVGTAVPLLIVVFSTVYVSIGYAYPGSFDEVLNHSAGLYFTVTVLSTVGFGDIVPITDVARLLVAVQMMLNLVLLGAIVRLVVSAARNRLAHAPAPGRHSSALGPTLDLGAAIPATAVTTSPAGAAPWGGDEPPIDGLVEPSGRHGR